MADRTLSEGVRAARLRGDPRHSPAYHYIKRNFRTFVRAGYGDGPGLGWAALRDMLNGAGQVNMKGEPLTTHAAMVVFKRVRADVAAEKAARAACPPAPKRRTYIDPAPGSIKQAPRPAVPPVARAPVTHPAAAGPGRSGAGVVLRGTAETQAKIAALMEDLSWHGRYRPDPKPKA